MTTETVGLLGTGAQDVHLDFHTAPGLCRSAWKSYSYPNPTPSRLLRLFPSLISLVVSVDVTCPGRRKKGGRYGGLGKAVKRRLVSHYDVGSNPPAELRSWCESRGGRPGLPSLISLTVSMDVKQHSTNESESSEPRSCVKVEVSVLGSPSLISLTVSVDVKQHFNFIQSSSALSGSPVSLQNDVYGHCLVTLLPEIIKQ